MSLDAAQVEALQNAQPPTDWSKHDQQLGEYTDGGTNRFAFDNRLHVRFYAKPKLNIDMSNEQNRPVYEDTIYVEIMMPGEKHNIIQRPAFSQRDDLRFPQHFAKFKQGHEQLVGTPLKVLPFLTEAQIEEFVYFNVRTVEQLADLADSVQFMGAQDCKQRAKKWLEATRSGETLVKENTELKSQLASMQEQINSLLAAKTAPAVDPLS